MQRRSAGGLSTEQRSCKLVGSTSGRSSAALLDRCCFASAVARRPVHWPGRHRKNVVNPVVPAAMPRGPMLVVGMTSLPSRLRGAVPALQSIIAQDRRPDRLVLSLPRHSAREGRAYELPAELQEIFAQHPWMEVNWVDKDQGPGTKLLGALHWLNQHADGGRDGDILMVLDDDHVYLPFTLGKMLEEQQRRGSRYVCSFFAYFCRGIMVPQGADVIAYPLSSSFSADLLEFHRSFVEGDPSCFVVDDLWVGMYLRLCGREAVSLRDIVVKMGLEMVYKRTENASIEALMDLKGENRRDRVTVRAFDGLLERLLRASSTELQRWGGVEARQRLEELHGQVKHVDKQIIELGTWLEQERSRGGDGGYISNAQAQLNKMRHLWQMKGILPPDS
mmetsp:Transcript_46377/g.83901  ORF Transcript_46377/g.83901 Transcript_46377/m.83901 type:complete len:391 (+) Transcript_46377:120-1292(+)